MSSSGGEPRTSTGDFPPSVGALYLHVPFCVRRCAYCDFTSSAMGGADRGRLGTYARALSRLVDEVSTLGLFDGLGTAYVGGGTPTVLGPELPRLMGDVARAVGHPLEELSFEANPDSASPRLFEACRAAGATRVSVGVQSTDDVVLGKLGRLHDSRRALEAIEWAREAALRVSADLMAGVPGQASGAVERDAGRLAEAGVGHVSVYALEVHASTPFGALEARGVLGAPDEDDTADLLEEAERTLRARGYERYEVSNYARSGEESLHNLAYWTGVPYLGLGPSAASMLTADLYRTLQSAHDDLPDLPDGIVRARLTCVSSIDAVADAHSLADLRFEVEGLTERQALAEDLMLAARLADGIAAVLTERAERTFGPAFDAVVADLVEDGLLSDRAGACRPTERGWLLGNALYGALWGLAGDMGTWTG